MRPIRRTASRQGHQPAQECLAKGGPSPGPQLGTQPDGDLLERLCDAENVRCGPTG